MKKIQTPNAKGEVRIIAGLWRGRKLPVLNSEGLRPTGDRVKETLFNWLMPYIHQSECLDGFAGSGSLGFEALSRQAKKVICLELDKIVANQLKKNLPQNQPHFDVVFLDPPFHFNLAEQAISLLCENNWLKPNALIYVETEKDKPLITPENWTLVKEKTTGMVSYRLYQN